MISEVTTLKDRFFVNLEHIGNFESCPTVAVAISGGIDSMALLWLAYQWVQSKKGRIKAITVDHCLRAESADEALWVHNHCNSHHIDHDILTWHHPPKLTGNVMAQAREARYQLLQDYCYQHSILHLLVGHQANDQLETFILHLERGSGLKGLSSMTPITYLLHTRLLRPLLREERITLQALLHSVGWEWREDSSNTALHYDRTKIRKALQNLVKEHHLTISRWLASITALAQAQCGFDKDTLQKIPDLLQIYPEGFITIDREKMKELFSATRLEILVKSITVIGGNIYAPRWYQLEVLENLIQSKTKFKRTTLGGCLVVLTQDQIIICREFGAIKKDPIHLKDHNHFLWDNRFMIEGSVQTSRACVTSLGEKGWQQMIAVDKTLKKLPYPREVALALPAIWQQGKEGLDILVAVPHLSFETRKIKKGSSILNTIVIHYKPCVHLHTTKKYIKLTPEQAKKDYYCG